MNAKEARNRAMSINTTLLKEQYDKIKQSVAKAVETGKLGVTLSLTLYTGVRVQLKEEGFTISEYRGDQRNEATATINW